LGIYEDFLIADVMEPQEILEHARAGLPISRPDPWPSQKFPLEPDIARDKEKT
jgi:hypothetical protein